MPQPPYQNGSSNGERSVSVMRAPSCTVTSGGAAFRRGDEAGTFDGAPRRVLEHLRLLRLRLLRRQPLERVGRRARGRPASG